MLSRAAAIALSSLGFLLVGCGINIPAYYPISDYTRRQLLGKDQEPEPVQFDAETEAQIEDYLYSYFGSPRDPYMPASYMSDEEADSTFRGFWLYQKHCIHCHGLNGGGNGPTAPFLFPRPRDYRMGIFKWKSTSPNAKPTREDLKRLIETGANGSSMPPFRLLPEDQLEDLVSYVVFLSKRGELERQIMQQTVFEEEIPDAETVAGMMQGIDAAWRQADQEVTYPAESMPEYRIGSQEYEESLHRGAKLFTGKVAACSKCHLDNGTAELSRIPESELKTMFDDWGNRVYPRNLRLGIYRGGRRPIDVYRRIHNGIKGSVMPEGGKNLKPQEIWDLVNLVRALPYRIDLLPRLPDETMPSQTPTDSQAGH